MATSKKARLRTPAANHFKEFSDGTAIKDILTDHPIATLEEAIAAAEVDTSVWMVDRWEAAAWSVPMKLSQGQEIVSLMHPNGKKVEALSWRSSQKFQTQQHRVRIFLKRIQTKSQKEAFDGIFKMMEEYAPKYPNKAIKTHPASEPMLAVFALFDAHFGKLAWEPETGENYDLKIADTIYRNAVEDLIAESAHRKIGRILFPIGNDFFHMDNRNNATTAGTPQDVDGRYAKIMETGERAVIWAVERLAEIAPVDVIWVPGNHDLTTSYHLVRTIKAWFRNHKNVTVDAGPSPRKYYSYGKVLLGFTHGNEEKHEALPNLMANERPMEHATSVCREWMLGHLHQSKKFQTQPVDTRSATVIRFVRSLAGTDAWHHKKGYLSLQHAAEVYWYSAEEGYKGHAVAVARE